MSGLTLLFCYMKLGTYGGPSLNVVSLLSLLSSSSLSPSPSLPLVILSVYSFSGWISCSLQFHLGLSQLAPWITFSSIVISQWCLCIFSPLDSVQLCCLFWSPHSSLEQKQLLQLEPFPSLVLSFPIIQSMTRLSLCKHSCFEFFLHWLLYCNFSYLNAEELCLTFSSYRILKVLASLLSPTAFALGSINFADYERAHVGLRWSNIWRVSSTLVVFDSLSLSISIYLSIYLSRSNPSLV